LASSDRAYRLKDLMAPLDETLKHGQDRAQPSAERQQLQTLLGAIIPYLPQPVVEKHLTDPDPGRVHGEYWEGSVLFADVSGFTALSETLSRLGKEGAEVITGVVNDLFGALLEEVERFEGVLVKFGGDALTVYFGGQKHSLRAARAGLALQETMARRFVNLETPGGVFTLRLRVGVHTGKIFAAQVGTEPGYPLRGMELVVTGTDINRVAQAQDFAAPGEVCITPQTLGWIADVAEVEPVSGGMFRLERLVSLGPLEGPRQLSPWALLDDSPLPFLRVCLDALRPYLPVDLEDGRITDPSDPELRPQLRLVAVLFANFADFSAILGRLTAEHEAGVQAATRILNTYYARMQDVIGRFGGVVNKVDMYTQGDKLMAVFGAPLAREDAAERAVGAALAMQHLMPEINRQVREMLEASGGESAPVAPLTQRIGINFGHVFAGNVGSGREGSRREYTVMGDTVNLAARLMSVCETGGILISPSVRRQVSDRFKLEDLSPVVVKGKAEPIPVARPLRPLTDAERAELRGGRRRFISRTAQLDAMVGAATRAVAGLGGVVAIVGEAGMGKTRLVEAFQDFVTMPPVSLQIDIIVTELPSYLQEPYAPIADLLRQLIGLEGDTAQDIVRLRNWSEMRVPEMSRFLPLLGPLLALPIADNRVTAALTPDQRHARLEDLIEEMLHREARRGPLVLVVDDLQWVDESSRLLLARLARELSDVPLLLVLCYRPDVAFATPWTELHHTSVLQVTEFNEAESTQLVSEVLGTEQPPEGLAEMVWTRAQGNPFFTEEFVKSLRETGAVVDEGDRWVLIDPQDYFATIPDTVEEVVLARLDRIEARCREVLQEASVAAASQRRFLRSLLERVDPHPIELPGRLRSLVEDGLLEQIVSELEALEYHFRHTVTRDVAYDSLLYAQRRELHHLIARALETLHPGRLDEYVTPLAHHYLEAENWPQAYYYQRRAGERAQVLFANKDAVTFFRQALSLGEERLPDLLEAFDAEEFVESLIDVHERLGDVLLLEGRHDAALAAYASARRLLTKEDAYEVLARLYRKNAVVYERKAEYARALEWLERGLEALGEWDVAEKAKIYNFVGGVYYRQGERKNALDWRQRALEIARKLGDQREVADAYLIMAMIYSDWGDTDRALEFGHRCLEAFEAAGDLAGSIKARNNVGLISHRADDWDQAVEHYREGLRLSEMMGDGLRIGQFSNNMGNVYLGQGRLEEAAVAYQRAIAVLEPLGLRGFVAGVRVNLGKVAVSQGDLGAGETYLSTALALAEEIGARFFIPEIYHWQALVRLEQGQHEQALGLAHQAHNLAQEIQDRAEEGRALRVLGRICRALGRMEEAQDHLEASLACLVELKSTYEVAKTLFQLAQVYLARPDQREDGRALLDQARALFADLGARGDLAAVEGVIERLSDQP
jgi:class 3 adenylate cyclase/predicted ATPase